MHLTRQRLSNAYSIRAESSCSDSSRVVWDLQIQDWQEIPGQIEIGRAVAEIQDLGELSRESPSVTGSSPVRPTVQKSPMISNFSERIPFLESGILTNSAFTSWSDSR